MRADPVVDWVRFAEVFNDTAKYPQIADVAVGLGYSYQTVRNRACVLRKLRVIDPTLPEIIERSGAFVKKPRDPEEKPEATPQQHAHARAVALSQEVEVLLTSTNWPVVNPEAIVVESHLVRRYDREQMRSVLRESTPRTWLADTLRVAPIKDCRNKTFIFTGAQNDAEIHEGFWANLQAYAAELGAQIAIGPLTYETQWWSENNPASRSYHPDIQDHLCFGQLAIGDNFMFAGEMNTLPTASKPISDLVTYSRGKWGVFPHAKRQLKSVPSTDPNEQASQVMTTGLVTKPKVIPRKAGVKSIFHHVIGAVIVEFDDEGDIFCRHITANRDGSFYDLDAHVAGAVVIWGKHRARAVTMPDIHRDKLGPVNAKALFGVCPFTGKRSHGLLDELNPEFVVDHDIFDNARRNHHNDWESAYLHEISMRKRDSVEDEVYDCADFLIKTGREDCITVIAEGNHDLALERWVREDRYLKDGPNVLYGTMLKKVYLEYRSRVAAALNAHQPVPTFSLLEYAVRQICSPEDLKHVAWVHDGSSFIVDGIELGNHGFRGPNGTRGTVEGFARIGRKITIGDKHSPEINEGVFVAGAMELKHGYNKGLSGWAVTPVIQYPDGKRTLVTLQKGKWRARRRQSILLAA